MSLGFYLKDIFVHPALYRKFWIAFINFVVVAVTLQFGAPLWFPALTSFLSSVGVFQYPNGQ